MFLENNKKLRDTKGRTNNHLVRNRASDHPAIIKMRKTIPGIEAGAPNHIGDGEWVAKDPEQKDGWDYGLEPRVVAPVRVPVHYSRKNWPLLALTSDPYFNHPSERGNCFHVLCSIGVWSQVSRT